MWIEDLMGTRPGDTNLDGQVEFGDFLQFSTTFGQTDVGWGQGDFTGDGQTDFADFLLLANQFGFSAQPQEPDSE